MADDTLGDLLDEARHRRFVGRAEELESFRRVLVGESPQRVLFVHGPGGIGKTTLLRRFRSLADAHGRSVVELDGRDQALTAESIEGALVDASADVVLLLDGYEELADLDGWIRGQLLPSLGAGSLTVLSGRAPPAVGWRRDPGWRLLMSVHRISELPRTESAELLSLEGVEPDAHDALISLARGLPLALTLLADAARNDRMPAKLADAPDVVAALLPNMVHAAPTSRHRAALELCTFSFVTTRDLLQYVFDDGADEMWHWLEQQPFVARSPLGLHPHDLARDVLLTEHSARGPLASRPVSLVLHRYARRRFRDRPVSEAYVVAMNLMYLHREGPISRLYDHLRDRSVAVVPGRASDHATVVAMIRRHQGVDEAELARRWLRARPESLRVIRRDCQPVAFAIEPLLPADGGGLDVDDPVIVAILEHIEASSPLRPREEVSIGRFFGTDSDANQADPLAELCGSVGSLATWQLRAPAWSFIVTDAVLHWEPVFDYLAFDHRVETPGDRFRVAYGMDWRRVSLQTWNAIMIEREVTGETGPLPQSMLRPRPLGRDEFAAAVRHALTAARDPKLLTTNPLLGTQLVADPGRDRPDQIIRALQGAISELSKDPTTEESARVLDRTYLRGAPSQEAAAEVLSLSFSTYRRRLGRALEALIDALWEVELGQRPADQPRSRPRTFDHGREQ